MTEAVQGGALGPAWTRVALATTPEPIAGDATVHGADGVRRRVGDRWPEDGGDKGVVVTLDTRNGSLNVILAFRMDGYSKREWKALEAMSIVIALLPMAPVASFALGFDDIYARGAYPIGADPADAEAVRGLALDPMARKTLTVVGMGRGRIRSVKVGLGLDRIWELLAEAFAGSPIVFDDDAYYATLDRLRVPPKTLFIAAMTKYFEPMGAGMSPKAQAPAPGRDHQT